MHANHFLIAARSITSNLTRRACAPAILLLTAAYSIAHGQVDSGAVLHTTLTAAVEAGPAVLLKPASMEGVAPGAEVMIGADRSKEPTTVIEVFRDGFTAKIGQHHEAGELIGVSPHAESCINHGKTALLEPPVDNPDHTAQRITPGCMAGIKPGAIVFIGSGEKEETAEVISVRNTNTFTVSLGHKHDKGETVVIAVTPCSTGAQMPSSQGLITVGCPKIWRSDRVFTVLDGILRDVDAITIKALQDLNPNQTNLAELVSVLNDTQVAAKFSQADLVNNSLKAQKIKVTRAAEVQNFNTAQKTNQQILKAIDERTKKLIDLQKEADDLDPDSAAFKTNAAKQKAVTDEITALSKQSQTQAITDQTVTGTSADAAQTKGATISIPDTLKNSLQDALKSPTLPAAVQMDNVIELLHQRLSREFAVMYDDLTRMSDTYDIFLMQFDIGIVPKGPAKNRDASIEFKFNDPTILAYELYPSASSYNILRGMDKTNRFGISGAAQTLFGFGMSAAFSHERNELRSGMSQTLFVSGYGAGTNDFGWLLGPEPIDNLLNPGTRTVHALILVPKTGGQPRPDLGFTVSCRWVSREKRYKWLHRIDPFEGFDIASDSDQGKRKVEIRTGLPTAPHLAVEQVSYNPFELKQTPASGDSATLPDTNTVMLRFKESVDPNLTITAGNKLLKRVRDVRGRALFGGTDEQLLGNKNEQALLSKSRFGLLESDVFEGDTWLQLNSHTVLLNISNTTAGTDNFPVITLADPGSQGGELDTLLVDNADIHIGEWKFKGTGADFIAAQLPLVTQTYSSGRIRAYVDDITRDLNGNATLLPLPQKVRINSETWRDGRNSPVWLHANAQVVLQDSSDPQNQVWALQCRQERGSLSCAIPPQFIAKYRKEPLPPLPSTLKIWVDEPPYVNRPGLWADDDIKQTHSSANSSWQVQPYALGDWTDIREVSCEGCLGTPDRWEATIRLQNLVILNCGKESSCYSIREIPEVEARQKSKRPAKAPAATSAQSRNRLRQANARPVPEEATGLNAEALKLSSTYTAKNLELYFRGWQIDASSKDRLRKQIAQSATELKDYKIVFNIDPTEQSLTLTVPFAALPLVTDRLHLQRKPSGTTTEEDASVLLPELRSRLRPGVVTVTDFNNGTYRIEGERMRAVDQVRIEGNGLLVIADTSLGLNSVSFTPTHNNKPLPPGTYAVSGIIRSVTVPLQTEDQNKKLQPVTITVPDPKAQKPQSSNRTN